MARTNKRVEGVGLLWGVVEIIADIFLVLTIMNLLFLTSQW